MSSSTTQPLVRTTHSFVAGSAGFVVPANGHRQRCPLRMTLKAEDIPAHMFYNVIIPWSTEHRRHRSLTT